MAGGVTYPEPDVTNCGGVTAFMKIARLAEAFNLPVTSHGAHDVTLQLLAACPNRSYLEAHGFGLDRYIATACSRGWLRHGTRPAGPRHRVRLAGHGVNPGVSDPTTMGHEVGRLGGLWRSRKAALTMPTAPFGVGTVSHTESIADVLRTEGRHRRSRAGRLGAGKHLRLQQANQLRPQHPPRRRGAPS